MIASKPYIRLNRLIVLSGPRVAYDQMFHAGLNILRGENSSGKSTILDFIFYALGGDIIVWKTAASQCTAVVAEVEINGTTLTLQRAIDEHNRRPMAIFFGPYEKSIQSRFLNWREYPYASSQGPESFSKFLFRTLEYPEVRADLDSNLTMNQVMRLCYIDQISRTTALMREEDWDSNLKRQTIGELMFGVYDDTLYADQISLKLREAEEKDISLQITNAKDVFAEVGENIDADKVKKLSDSAHTHLKKINEDIEKIQNGESRVKDTSATEIESLRKELQKLRSSESELAERLAAFDYEIVDASVFIQNINDRLKALDDSIGARAALGELPHCPLCAIPLTEINGKVNCTFSGREIKGDFGRANMLKMREELHFQALESKTLQESRFSKRERLFNEISALRETIEVLRHSYQLKVKSVKSARDNRLDELYTLKGQHEANLEHYARMQKYVEVMAKLMRRKIELVGYISQLKTSIEDKKKKMYGRWFEANQAIEKTVRYILGQDLRHQEEFHNVNTFQLDFQKNTFHVNGKNNFSASSNAVLKNAVNFGILFSATEDPLFRFPRFILCDNIEDGGMTPDRSKNFQRIIAEMSTQATQPFQIIFSTSMIDESLNDSPYCVGPYYTKLNKSLNLGNN